jgi:hypothetical protein
MENNTNTTDTYKHIERISQLMDGKFNLFGIRFGLDPIIGLVPVLGDIIPVVISLYLVWCARNLGLPSRDMGRMLGNIAIDFAVGFIPILGDAADFALRSNQKNFKIISEHQARIIR